MLQIGSVLDGKYKILSEIGRGGMSVVYLALNEKANKTWAVKEVRKDGGNDARIVTQNLAAETEMLKQLSHPNLPSIVDVIDTSDTFIIVMDYIEGQDLQKLLNEKGPQSPERVVEWAKQLCDVLGYLHSRRPPIIYRDMKPSNVMLQPNGQVALLDFGTARQYKEMKEEDTTYLGTRGYAAPEQFGGRGQTDPRTDIYCLGATMYHLLTGYSPADTQFYIYPIGQLVPSFTGTGIEKVVAKCCEPDPANRYQSCAELMYALEHVHDEDNVVIGERNRKWRLFMTSCIVAIIGLVGMAGFAITHTVAENNSYDEKLINAQAAQNFETKAALYAEAIDVKPDRIDAYKELLEAAVTSNDEGETGKLITSKEYGLLKSAYDPYLSEFSRKNHSDYVIFVDKQAGYYFTYYRTSKQPAADLYRVLVSEDEDDGYYKCMNALCNIYVANNTQSNVEEIVAGGSNAYRESWDTLVEIAGSNDKADTLDKVADGVDRAAMIYREIAREISGNQVENLDAGITVDEMNAMLDVAAYYVNTHGSSNKVVAEAGEAVEKAKHQLNQDLKSDNGAGTAPVTTVGDSE